MIDVSRHFHPVEVLKRNIDAMASMKMNVFHWHLSDDQGFRIESSHYPRLHELGSDGLFYTKNIQGYSLCKASLPFHPYRSCSFHVDNCK